MSCSRPGVIHEPQRAVVAVCRPCQPRPHPSSECPRHSCALQPASVRSKIPVKSHVTKSWQSQPPAHCALGRAKYLGACGPRRTCTCRRARHNCCRPPRARPGGVRLVSPRRLRPRARQPGGGRAMRPVHKPPSNDTLNSDAAIRSQRPLAEASADGPGSAHTCAGPANAPSRPSQHPIPVVAAACAAAHAWWKRRSAHLKAR
jgi:hypothetical protein